MNCYILKKGQTFAHDSTPKAEVSAELQKEILRLCEQWQARNLSQRGASDDYEGETLYEALTEENFVVMGKKVVGYYADHFDKCAFVPFPIKGTKVSLGSYDFSDYGNTWKVNRGHVAIVPRPDTDTNPYHDEARFHSKEEYDDYIKWRD